MFELLFGVGLACLPGLHECLLDLVFSCLCGVWLAGH